MDGRRRRACRQRCRKKYHLIEAAKRGRLDQMIFFSAPLTTRAPPGRPAERPAWYGSHQFEQTYV